MDDADASFEDEERERSVDCQPLQHQRREEMLDDALAAADSGKAMYLAFVVIGSGFLFPYNSFITAVDYFQAIYPSKRYEFFVTLVYFYTTLCAVFLSNVVLRVVGLESRIRVSYVLFCFPLVTVMVLTSVISNEGTDTTFAVTMIGIVVVSFAGGIQQASYYGFTGMLPRKYTQAIMTGESVAGLAVSIDRLITKAAFSSCRTSALVFFGIALVFNIVCAALYEFVQRTSFVQHHLMTCHSVHDHVGVYRSLRAENVTELQVYSGTQSNDADCIQLDKHNTTSELSGRFGLLLNKLGEGWQIRKHVIRRLWHLMLTISVVYFVTLLLFPGLLSEVKGPAFRDDWLPVILIAIFNLFDFVGKVFANWHYKWKEGHLIAISLARFVLIPLLVLCIVPCQSPAFGSASEYVAMALAATIGITNGYFGCMAMVLSPSRVESTLREVAGNLMTLMLLLGLTAGATMAFLLNHLTSSEEGSLCYNSNATVMNNSTC